MNPTRFLLLLAILVLFGNCTKESIVPETPNILTNSSFELFYPDNTNVNSNDRIAILNPPYTTQPCKANIPSIIVPRIDVGNKAIRWNVNGETANQLTAILKLPYAIDEYDVEAIVILKDGNERRYEFTLNVTHNMPLDFEGYIEYYDDDICVTGPTVGPSCLPQNGKASSIVIIDPNF